MTPDAAYERFNLGKFVRRLESLEMYEMSDLINRELGTIETINISQSTTPEGRDAAYQKEKYRNALVWFGTVIWTGGIRNKPTDAGYFYPLLRKLVELGSLEQTVLEEINK